MVQHLREPATVCQAREYGIVNRGGWGIRVHSLVIGSLVKPAERSADGREYPDSSFPIKSDFDKPFQFTL